jgi:hypothetical protein
MTLASSDEQLLWLANQMNDHTIGNSTFVIDWGNHTIACGSPELKNRLSDLVADYRRLKANELTAIDVALAGSSG